MVRRTQPLLAELPTFFVDRCLGPKTFAQPLRGLGYQIEIHDDHFAPETQDELWIPEVARRSWIIVSADFRIRHRAPEIEAFRACGARMLLLAQKLSVKERLDFFVDAYHKVEKAIRTLEPPWVARIFPDRSPNAAGRRRAKLEILEISRGAPSDS